MNKMTIFLLIIIVALSFGLGTTMQSKAQDKSFTGVLPFATNSRVGFFDQSTGKVYVYDSNFTNCLFVGQMDTLGQAIKVDSTTPTNALY
jgi:hypothetical protein